MAGSATLNVKVLVDAAQAAAGLNQVAGKFQDFAGKAIKMFAGAFAVDKVIGGVKSVVNAAADMEQAVGGTDRIFKESAKSIHDWASNTEDAFRVPALEAEKFATTMGNSLQQAGRSSAQAAQEVKTLGQVAADLASAYGGDVVDALDAVNAAISKGEWERLESFGVTIKASDVSAEVERIASSMGGLTDANRSAIETQAKINLLMKEAAPAAGAAAAETLTFTGRVDALKEKVNNAAGQIGGPLLDGFGGLIDRMTSAVPFFTTLATGLAAVVGWVVQLPAPLFNAAVAMAALALASSAGWITSLVSGFQAAGLAITNFYVQAKLMQAQALATGTSMSTMGALARTGVAGIAQFSGALKMAGVAAGLAVVTIAITGFIQRLTAAGKAFDTVEQGLGDVTAELRKTGGAWTDTAEKMFQAKFVDSNAFKQLVQEGFSANEILEILTGTYEHWYDVQSSGRGSGLTTDTINEVNAYRDLHGILPQVAAEQGKFNELTKSGSDVTDDATRSQEEYEKAVSAANKTLSDQQAHFDILAGQTGVSLMLDEIAAAQDRVSRGAEALNAMFEQADGRSSSYEQSVLDTTTAITGIGEAFKKAHDDGKPVADLIANWDWGGIRREMPDVASGLLSIRKSLGESTIAAFEAGGGFKDYGAGLAAAGVQMQQNEADFRAMLAAAGLVPEEIDAIVGSMEEFNGVKLEEKLAKIKADDFEARKTALFWQSIKFDPINQQFTTTVPGAEEIANQLNREAGLAEIDPLKVPSQVEEPKSGWGAQVAGLVAGIVPTVTGITIPTKVEPPTLGGAVSGAIGSVLGSLFGGGGGGKTPPVTIPSVVEAPSSVPPGPVGQALTAGGAVTGGTVQVQVQASTEPAQMAITALTTQSRTLTIQVAANVAQAQASISGVVGGNYSTTVHVLGENAGAITAVRNVTTGRYETTVHVLGDNNPAIASIRSVTTGRYETTVHILGDNNDAIRSIRNITTGYYSATVYIGADASNFYSVWNSLPTSRTITVTVNQVQGSVVAPPPGGRAAPLAAPALAAFATAPAMPAVRSGKASRAGGSGNINITVEAGLGDPDAIARRIEQVLVARDRRSGGVRIGAMRARVGGGVVSR